MQQYLASNPQQLAQFIECFNNKHFTDVVSIVSISSNVTTHYTGRPLNIVATIYDTFSYGFKDGFEFLTMVELFTKLCRDNGGLDTIVSITINERQLNMFGGMDEVGPIDCDEIFNCYRPD